MKEISPKTAFYEKIVFSGNFFPIAFFGNQRLGIFILFINEFHATIEFSLVHPFADDTNLLQHINRDLKLAVEWFRANKLSRQN